MRLRSRKFEGYLRPNSNTPLTILVLFSTATRALEHEPVIECACVGTVLLGMDTPYSYVGVSIAM